MPRSSEIVNTVLATCLSVACARGDTEAAADHPDATLVLESDAIAAAFAPDGITAPMRMDVAFRRIALRWDSQDDAAIEVRTSADGASWSAWTVPAVVPAEEGARAGHVDVVEDAAIWLQLRVGAGKAAPTFLAIEPRRPASPREQARQRPLAERGFAERGRLDPEHVQQ